ALAFDPPAPRPTINSFTANLSGFDSGDSVVLRWDTTAADSVEITPNVGPVNATGSANFTATLTEIYTLTATNAEGGDECHRPNHRRWIGSRTKN
ncbi:MAG: hypothetical protein ACJ0HK_07630, partial [Akkermansiaceae bacterium]